MKINSKNYNDLPNFWVNWNFFLFLLSSLVTALSFMSISSLILDLWQFPFIRELPEIKKLEKHISKFWAISEVWGEFGYQICYKVAQNFRFTVIIISELLSENKLGVVELPPLRSRLTVINFNNFKGKHYVDIAAWYF